MRENSNFLQIYGIVCPFTGKIRFIEIAKNAKASYETLLRAAHLFADPISEWVSILEKKGVKPGFAMLDEKTADGPGRKEYWEKFYKIVKIEEKSTVSKRKKKKGVTPNYRTKVQLTYKRETDEETEFTGSDSSEQNSDLK